MLELLVVTAMMAVLASLMLPAIQSARGAARRAHCLNNLRKLGLALQQHASSHGDRLPHLTSTGEFALDYSTTAAPGLTKAVPWTVHLLPYLDRETLYERLLAARGDTPWRNDTATLARSTVEHFNCPDDLDSELPGNLSYAANGGYATENVWPLKDSTSHQLSSYRWAFAATAEEHLQATFATGVFWREENASGPSKPLKLSFVAQGDGLSHTLALSENINIRPYLGPGSGGWASEATADIAFLLSVAREGENTVASITRETDGVGLGRTGGKAAGLALRHGQRTFDLTTDADPLTSTSASRINAHLRLARDGAAPRPSSWHRGVVNVLFCDGHGRALSERIEDDVYARLISSNGGDFGQDILDAGSF